MNAGRGVLVFSSENGLVIERSGGTVHNVNWYPRREEGPAIVRCRSGHLFTTVWVPFGSFKALRFGRLRYQRCPVGEHWTFVERVDNDDVTDGERQLAEQWFDGAGP